MSDEFDDDPVDLDSLLDSLTTNLGGRSSNIAATAGPSGAVDDYLKDQFRLGRSLTGTPVQAVEMLENAKRAKQDAVQRRISALDAATQRLMAPRNEVNLPLMAAAGALLAPTRTGRFTESLGKAFESSIGPIANERQKELARDQKLTELDVLRAQANEALAGVDFDFANKRMDMGQKILSNAVNAQSRRDVAQTNADARKAALSARVDQANKPVVRVVQGVGLVEYDPKTKASRTIVGSPDPRNDPRVRAAYSRLVQNVTKDFSFPNPQDRLEYERGMVDTLLSAGSDFNPASVVSDLETRQVPRATKPSPSAAVPGSAAVAPGEPAVETPPADAPAVEAAPAPVPAPPEAGATASPAQPARIDAADLAGRKKEAEEESKKVVTEAVEARQAAEAAGSTLSTIGAIRAIRAPTGRLAPAKEFFGSWAEAFGLKSYQKAINEAKDLTAFNAIATNVVLDKQIMQKGVQTEGDAQRMRETFVQMRNPMAANDLILRYAEAQATRSMEQSAFLEAFKNQHKTYKGAKAAWLDYIKKTPMVKKVNGQAVFFNEFNDKARAANEGMEGLDDAILNDWRSIRSQ